MRGEDAILQAQPLQFARGPAHRVPLGHPAGRIDAIAINGHIVVSLPSPRTIFCILRVGWQWWPSAGWFGDTPIV
jgi:hypothetical protein